MQASSFRKIKYQRGMTLVGLMFVLAIVGFFLFIAAKIIPTVSEYRDIKKAVQIAKDAGGGVKEMQIAFAKQASAGYITSITANDLVFDKTSSGIEISFAYSTKIPLVGPASLLLEYEGSTAKTTKSNVSP